MNIRCDLIFACHILLMVRVDLDECNFMGFRQRLRKLLVHWSYSFAWSAPVCVDFVAMVSVRGFENLGEPGKLTVNH